VAVINVAIPKVCISSLAELELIHRIVSLMLEVPSLSKKEKEKSGGRQKRGEER